MWRVRARLKVDMNEKEERGGEISLPERGRGTSVERDDGGGVEPVLSVTDRDSRYKQGR
jgi:hypothetical protein